MEAILHQHYVSPVITAMRPPFPACLPALRSLALGAEGSHACSPNGFSPGTATRATGLTDFTQVVAQRVGYFGGRFWVAGVVLGLWVRVDDWV